MAQYETRYHSSISDMRHEMNSNAITHEAQKHAYESGLRTGDIIKAGDGGNYKIELRTELRRNDMTNGVDMVTTGVITEIETQQYIDPISIAVDCIPLGTSAAGAMIDNRAMYDAVLPDLDDEILTKIDPPLDIIEQLQKDNEEWLEGSTINQLRNETNKWLEGIDL